MPNCIQIRVTCLVQPGDGIAPIVKAINRARKSVEIVIFRLNRVEIERALAHAVARGLNVHALIAYTNRGGERNLRDLEMRLLAAGVTVSRTDNDLIRYHGKMILIDRRQLFLLAFNFTLLDIEHSRSFGIITTNRKHIQEAAKLFEADTKRTSYAPGSATFLVSPVNARKELAGFLRGARRELLIYDPEISDPEMMRVLEARSKAGVEIRIIGAVSKKAQTLTAKKMPSMRLHTRTIVRDGKLAFVGSQSLRTLELDARREIGIIFRDPKAVARLAATFQSDWESKERAVEQAAAAAYAGEDEKMPGPDPLKVAKKVAKAVAKDLGPITPMVESTVKEATPNGASVGLNSAQIESTVKNAVRDAVREVVQVLVEDAVEVEPEETPAK